MIERPKLLVYDELSRILNCSLLMGSSTVSCMSAQRDHDASYYEPEIARLEAELAKTRREAVDWAAMTLQQTDTLAAARTETAREIIGDLQQWATKQGDTEIERSRCNGLLAAVDTLMAKYGVKPEARP